MSPLSACTPPVLPRWPSWHFERRRFCCGIKKTALRARCARPRELATSPGPENFPEREMKMQAAEASEQVVVSPAFGRASRPRIHTYFEKPPGLKDSALVLVWQHQWHMAGFDPHVLSEATARRHPQWTALQQRWKAFPTVNHPEYEFACFARYAAMAVVGGGWMTDYDAMPLWPFAHDAWSGMNNVTGNFTVFQSHVPSLVHGSASEWTRVTELMSRVPWKLYPREFSHEGRPHVSDMWGNADSNQAPQPCTLHSLHLSPCVCFHLPTTLQT